MLRPTDTPLFAGWTAIVLAAISMLLVGYVDFLAKDIQVLPLYYVPIAVSSWRGSGTQAAIVGGACAAISLAAAAAPWATAVPWNLVFDAAANGVGFGLVGLLLASVRAAHLRDQTLGRVDPLTGMANRRAFESDAERIRAVAHRHGHSMSVAYIDLDDFKGVNDKRGHAGGDAVLRQVSKVLTHGLRTSDIVARLGGDEFAMVLPHTTGDGAKVVVDRIRIRLPESGIRCSVGVVAFPTVLADLHQMLSHADAIMYRAKRSGRDQVLVEVYERKDADR